MDGPREDPPSNNNNHNNDNHKLSSRISASRTFPVHLHHRHRSEVTPSTVPRSSTTTEERQHWPRRLFVDTSDLEPSSSAEKSINNYNGDGDNKNRGSHGKSSHRYSKSHLPRAVNQITSAGGARNLLPNRSFHRHGQGQGLYFGEKDKYSSREVSGTSTTDFSLLKPITHHDSSRSSRFGSRSSSVQRNSGSRAESLMTVAKEDDGELNWKFNSNNLRGRKEIKTKDDLRKAKEERKKGEELLRSKLASIGSSAIKITPPLDYTYYNLLERISSLQSTIHTFQELVDSSSALHESFQRDNNNLEQDMHRQLGEFANFEPQRRRINELERRMKAGRNKMEELGDRLDSVRKEIAGWERREGEWQARVSQRLAVLGGFMGIMILMVIVAYIFENWTATPASFDGLSSLTVGLNERIEMLSAQSKNAVNDGPGHGYSSQLDVDTDVVDVDVNMELFLKSPLLTKANVATTTDDTDTETSKYLQKSTDTDDTHASNTDPLGKLDPLRLFDEL